MPTPDDVELAAVVNTVFAITVPPESILKVSAMILVAKLSAYPIAPLAEVEPDKAVNGRPDIWLLLPVPIELTVIARSIVQSAPIFL